MMFRRNRVAVATLAIAVGSFATQAVAAPVPEQVLGSYTANGYIGAGLTADSICIFLGFDNLLTLTSPVGDARRIYGSTSAQTIEYRSDADDPHYSAFVARLTNGTTDPFFARISFWNTVVGGGSPLSGTEASLLGVSPDFTGHHITGLRLTIQPFEVVNVGNFTFARGPGDTNYTYTWQVLGNVPEPATLTVVAAAGLILLRRRGG